MSWGAVNIALNRLVAAGVITNFKTNFADGAPLDLHVIVTASAAARGRAGLERVRQQVSAELDPIVEGATVTVIRAG
jgi:hypothetical protein